MTPLTQQKTTQLETALQAVPALRAEKIFLEDRLAKAAAELAAGKQVVDVVTSLSEDLRTVKEDLKQSDIRLADFCTQG
jgi:hypothetical protein